MSFLTLIWAFVLFHNVVALYTTPPTWLTSNFVRAGNRDIISTLTGNSQTPTFTFLFSSPLPGIPNLGYGIKAYQGNDYLGQQYFEVYRTYLDAASFRVAVQIVGVTNIHKLNVPYIAVDPQFPHHLNSFDNVPVNYSATPLTNITTSSSSLQTYTNTIDYNQQTAGMTYRNFNQPYNRNKILLFLTSLFIAGSLGTNPPIIIQINSEVISSTHYKLTVTSGYLCSITKLHFSMVIFDQTDVLSSNAYMLVYQSIQLPFTGGFIPVPIQFVDNFIMGMQSFSGNKTYMIIDFQWDFATVNGVHGALMPLSVGQTSSTGGTQTLNKVVYTLFYMKTWLCLTQQPIQIFFDPDTDLCTSCPIISCIDCYNLTVCSLCDQSKHFFINSNGKCEINCSAASIYTTGVSSNITVCNCIPGFIWNSNTWTAVANCSNISFTAGSVAGSTIACNCQANYVWDVATGRCIVPCSTIANAVSLVTGTLNNCTCNVAYLYWELSSFSCKVNCSSITYATGLASGSIISCACQTNYSWESTLGKCVVPCSSIVNGVSLVSGTLNICTCNSALLHWRLNSFSCEVNCSQISYTTGPVDGSITKCTCSNNFNWDQQNYDCIAQCNQIRNALSISLVNNDQCVCRQGYGWQPATIQCRFLCQNIQYTAGLREGTQNQCNCIDSFVWDYTLLKCVVDCGAIPGALSLVEGTLDTCVCKTRFVWSTSKDCNIQCWLINNTIGSVAGTSDQCQCKQGFIWNSTFSECVIDCQSVEFSVGLAEGSYTECQCKKNYRWKGQLKLCILSCEDIEYTEQAWSLPDDIICPCMPDYIWNMRLKQCQYNCSAVENSTGEVMQNTTDVCICMEANVWDAVDRTCKGKQFDWMLSTIVGSGVISVAGLMNFAYIAIKKKLASLAMQRVVPQPSSLIIG